MLQFVPLYPFSQAGRTSIKIITIMKQINSVFNKQINENNKHNVVSLMSSYLPSEKKMICYKNHDKGFKK